MQGYTKLYPCKKDQKSKRIVLQAGFGLIAKEIAEEIHALTNIEPMEGRGPNNKDQNYHTPT